MTGDRLLRADLHTHTCFSRDGLTSPQSFVEACRRKALDCVAVTDHNTIRGALIVCDLADSDLRVIVGEEIKTAEGEIIGLFLEEEVPKGLSAEESVERVKAQGGIVGVPHPHDRLRSALKMESIIQMADRIDFIEALNARIIYPADNGRARQLAESLGLAMSAGSDAHSQGEVGAAMVEMPEFEGPKDFLEALRRGTLTGGLSSPLVHLLSRFAVLRRKLGWRPD